jgi:hypothetical protein
LPATTTTHLELITKETTPTLSRLVQARPSVVACEEGSSKPRLCYYIHRQQPQQPSRPRFATPPPPPLDRQATLSFALSFACPSVSVLQYGWPARNNSHAQHAHTHTRARTHVHTRQRFARRPPRPQQRGSIPSFFFPFPSSSR